MSGSGLWVAESEGEIDADVDEERGYGLQSYVSNSKKP